jgi:hypothetical protein
MGFELSRWKITTWVTYGYASTSHAAQGKTVDHGFLILGDEGMKGRQSATSLREQFTVSAKSDDFYDR